MHKIVIVEDDPIVANIYRNKLATEGFRVEVAGDGLAGLEMIRHSRPDATILDLMLPQMTGVELIKKLRSETEFQQLPLVVFSNTYLTNLVQEAWKVGASKCLSKANCTPKQVIEIVRGLLAPNGSATDATVAPATTAKPPVARPPSGSQPAPAARQPKSADADAEFQADLRKSFIGTLPATIVVLRTLLQGLIKAENETAQLKSLHELYRRVRALAGNAGVADVPQIARMADALEALLKELHDKPKNITASTLRTVASTVDCLDSLSKRGLAPERADLLPPVVLVVDDEAISRRAVIYALDKATLKSVAVEDAERAYELLAQNNFDLVFLDVDMPGMNGFELCTKLRSLPAHKKTPVVFVTSFNSFESRANSSMSGGNDFIGKPFLFIELAVKALVHILRGRLPAAK